MPEAPDMPRQKCPGCGTLVKVGEIEPLARVECPDCGEKFRVERAFDNFVLVETLGVGGMGSVYKARDTRLERFVALKLLRKELSADPAEAARLADEARVTAAVNHPNVVQVYSSGTAHGQIYLVMELVEHGSLDDLMAQQTRVPEVQVLHAGIQVARGLQAAYEKGLIHRDVKPANILFSDAKTAKIGDFGLAVAAEQKAEARKEIWGTPYYVAPERLNNEPEDFRSDIYSLGATLFHALAGKPPMEGETTSATELRQLKSHPPDLRVVAPDISRETARVINRMLAPNPANRFTSYAHLVDQLLRAYRALLAGTSGGARWKSPWLIAAAALLMLGSIGAGVFFIKAKRPAALEVAPAGPSPSPTPDNSAALQRRYEEARRLLLDGKYEQAAPAFTRLAADAKDRQPLLNWIRLHNGLVALLQGKGGPAREAFQQIERAGPFSNAKADTELAQFFLEISRTMAAAGPVRAGAVSNLNPKSAHALAFFLFGIKDWQLHEFGEGAGFLEKFIASEAPRDLAWIDDYKPMARKHLEDYRFYAEWKQAPRQFTTSAELRAALASLKALQGKLQMRSALSDSLQEEEKRLAAESTRREKAEKEAREAERKKLLEQESPAWNAALAEANRKIGLYDFPGALAVIDSAQVTEPSLKAAQTAERKKAAWLIDWKKRAIADLQTGAFKGPVMMSNTKYQGAAGATDSEITLRIPPYGSAKFAWGKFAPDILLGMSTAFIRPNAPDAADRQWLAAVFARATGQTEAAATLAEAAATSKPEYREQLRLLSPP